LYNLVDSKYTFRGKIVESIAFPKMFGVGRTNTVSDREATIQNLKLLLTSEKRELFCDPYFGDNLKRMLYEKNNSALKDILIDDIHVAIATFMPQVKVQHKDISVYADGTTVKCQIRGLNDINASPNVLEINLTDVDSEEVQ